jgi:hypothetical protein
MSADVRTAPGPVTEARRSLLERRVRWVVAVTITYNVVEAVIAISAGTVAGSAALVGFGLDSIVEVLSAAAVAWQFSAPDPETRERVALRVVALSFFGLALFVSVDSVRSLLGGSDPDHSTVGIVLAAVSLAVMPFLSWFERRTGRELGSATAVADSQQTLLCTYLSAVLLVGLLLNSLLGWSWADPVAALVIAGIAVREGIQAWRGDGCCAPGAALHGCGQSRLQAQTPGSPAVLACSPSSPAGSQTGPTCWPRTWQPTRPERARQSPGQAMAAAPAAGDRRQTADRLAGSAEGVVRLRAQVGPGPGPGPCSSSPDPRSLVERQVLAVGRHPRAEQHDHDDDPDGRREPSDDSRGQCADAGGDGEHREGGREGAHDRVAHRPLLRSVRRAVVAGRWSGPEGLPDRGHECGHQAEDHADHRTPRRADEGVRRRVGLAPRGESQDPPDDRHDGDRDDGCGEGSAQVTTGHG